MLIDPKELQAAIPEIRGLDPQLKTQFYIAFMKMYEFILSKVSQIDAATREQLGKEIKTSAESNYNSLIGAFAQPLVGSDSRDELLQGFSDTITVGDIPNLPASKITSGRLPLARLDDKVIHTDDAFTKTLGAPATDGYITIKDDAGNSVKVMTTS
jgi:hypothetical protein